MNHEMVFAGFGGQGVMMIGKMVTFAAMKDGKNVSWFPSYGPEMRGGTANCTVVVSDEEVGSPIVTDPTVVVAMNGPSFDRYEKDVRPGGLMLYNASMVDRKPSRTDISYVGVPAAEVANEVGNARVANIIIYGALAKRLPFAESSFVAAMEDALHKPELMPLNMKAFKRGMEI